jgi:hypothetical protein
MVNSKEIKLAWLFVNPKNPVGFNPFGIHTIVSPGEAPERALQRMLKKAKQTNLPWEDLYKHPECQALVYPTQRKQREKRAKLQRKKDRFMMETLRIALYKRNRGVRK